MAKIFDNILITGASSGIGEALAIYYASHSAKHLFLCGRNAQRLETVVRRCRNLGCAAEGKILDTTDEKSCRDWIISCNQKAPLNLVFANAGVATTAEIPQNIRRTFNTNVMGVVNTVLPTIEVFKSMPDNPTKTLALTASIAGYHGLPACPSYSASKACIKAWGEALRGSLRTENIAVSIICPGFVKSRITDQNTCPMPFFMSAEKSAEIIAERLSKNVGTIAFPWPMRLATWFISVLPNFLSDFIYSRLPHKV